MRTRTILWVVIGFAIAGNLLAVDPVDPEAERVVLDAMARAENIPDQARALALLAWPDPDRAVAPEVSAHARKVLVEFDSKGMHAIRESLQRCDRSVSGDITAALVEAMSRVTAGIPIDFFPAVEDALWYGSPEAQRLAMGQAARYGYGRAVLPIMDAAVESPELVPDAIEALAALRNDRGRFWLGDVVRGGSGEERSAAAAALARIGGPATQTLRELCLDADPETRRVSVLALSQVAGPDEVTTLHEYLVSFPDDDPRTLEVVRAAAVRIEKWIDQFHAGQGSEPEPEY